MKPLPLLLTLALMAPVFGGNGFRAGAARVRITPDAPLRMAGYAARTHASDGVQQELWAKALAIEDARGHRAVIVTMDLLRVPRLIVGPLSDELKRRHGLAREQLLLNCSHNHSGPTLWENDPFTPLSAAEYEASRQYTLGLTAKFADLVGEALHNLKPVEIRFGTGEATFGANRRVATPQGYTIAHNPDGPADHRVPVLKITGRDGKLIAVLFGYACHNTTLGPSSYRFAGDFAGYAQAALEEAHPGAVALFMQLTAGDQDPHPRGGYDVAQRHGRELAAAVEHATLTRVRGRLATAFESTELAFAPHTRETFEKRLNDPLAARVRNARAMLRAYDDDHPVRSLPYPIQAIALGKSLTLVALGGEPVVDYALRARREFPGVVLLGYSNEVRSYVPSRRVLAEGGYEAEESMLYYGLPGPYAPQIEEAIFSAIRDVLRRTRR
jgi:hypothetical protein